MYRILRKLFYSTLATLAFVIVVPLYGVGIILYTFAEWFGSTVSLWRQDKCDNPSRED